MARRRRARGQRCGDEARESSDRCHLRTCGRVRHPEIRPSASAGRTRRGHISGRSQMKGRSNAGAAGRSPRLIAATRLAPLEPCTTFHTRRERRSATDANTRTWNHERSEARPAARPFRLMAVTRRHGRLCWGGSTASSGPSRAPAARAGGCASGGSFVDGRWSTRVRAGAGRGRGRAAVRVSAPSGGLAPDRNGDLNQPSCPLGRDPEHPKRCQDAPVVGNGLSLSMSGLSRFDATPRP